MFLSIKASAWETTMAAFIPGLCQQVTFRSPLNFRKGQSGAHTEKSISKMYLRLTQSLDHTHWHTHVGVCWRELTSTFWSQWDLIVFYPVAAYSNIFTMRAIVSTPHTMFALQQRVLTPLTLHIVQQNQSCSFSKHASGGDLRTAPKWTHTHTHDK